MYDSGSDKYELEFYDWHVDQTKQIIWENTKSMFLLEDIVIPRKTRDYFW